MPGPVPLLLVDARGHPFAEPLATALRQVASHLLRDFPRLFDDDVEFVEMLEAAGERIRARLGKISVEHLEAFVGKALYRLAFSRGRLLRKRVRRVPLSDGNDRSLLDVVQASFGTAREIEVAVLLQEALATCTPDESAACRLHEEGYTFRQIAEQRGCSVEAARAAHRRAFDKARKALQIQPEHRDRGESLRGVQPRPVKAVTTRAAGARENDERKAG